MDAQKKVSQVAYSQYLMKKNFNSPSRARTYNLAVNSRSLYQLSYRGMLLPDCPSQTRTSNIS